MQKNLFESIYVFKVLVVDANSFPITSEFSLIKNHLEKKHFMLLI